MFAKRSERLREDVKPLVPFEAAHAQQHEFVVRHAGRGPDPTTVFGLRQPVYALEVQRVGDRDDPLVCHPQVSPDRRFEGPIRRDHRIRGGGTGADRPLQRQVAETLEPGSRRIGRAELLEPLRIQNQRCLQPCPAPRVAEDAGAEAVDEVDVATCDHLGRDLASALPESRIGGAAIEDGRPSSSGQREGAVGNESQGDGRIHGIGCGWLLGCARDQRDRDAFADEVARQVEHAAFEPAQAVNRKHRTGRDRDTERPFHVRRL